LKKILTTVAAGLMAASISFATATLTFRIAAQPTQTGPLSYASSTLTGTSLIVDQLTVGGAIHNGTYTVLGGVLNLHSDPGTQDINTLKTGNALGLVGGLLDFTGGAYSLTGSITGVPTSSGTLTSGSFDSITYVAGAGNLSTVTAFGSDTKDDAMENYFGFPASTLWNFSFTLSNNQVLYSTAACAGFNTATRGVGTCKPPANTSVNAFVADANGGQLQDSTDASAVPEPASILLFSGVLLGVASFAKRRLHKQV
jgi:hypothetical protein